MPRHAHLPPISGSVDHATTAPISIAPSLHAEAAAAAAAASPTSPSPGAEETSTISGSATDAASADAGANTSDSNGHGNHIEIANANLIHAVCGSTASVLSMTLCYPLDVLRTVMQLSTTSESPPPSAADNAANNADRAGGRGSGSSGKSTAAHHFFGRSSRKVREIMADPRTGEIEGPWAVLRLYRGLLPVCQTVAISQFLYFYVFQLVKSAQLTPRLLALLARLRPPGSTELSASSAAALESFLGSLLAGVLNMIITEPLWKANIIVQQALKKNSSADARTGSTSRRHDMGTTNPSSDPASSVNDKNGETLNSGGQVAQTKARLGGGLSGWRKQSVLHVVLQLARENGVANLWSGVSTSLYLVSNPVLQYALYDVIKARVAEWGKGSRRAKKSGGQATQGAQGAQISALQGFMIGALTKAIATLLTYPLQVAQSLLRASTGKSEGSEGSATAPKTAGGPKTPGGKPSPGTAPANTNTSFWSCFIGIYRKDGLAGYARGLGPKMLQTVINSAFMFYFYEAILRAVTRVLADRRAMKR